MAWTVLDDKIWIAGGMSHGDTLHNSAELRPADRSMANSASAADSIAPRDRDNVPRRDGGHRGRQDELADASNKVFAFRDGKWVELPSLTHARAAAAAAVVGDKLVVVGGQNDKQLVATDRGVRRGVLDRTRPTCRRRVNTWPQCRTGYVYTVGGRFLSADKNSAAFERFDPESGQWTKLVDMPTPRGSYGATFIDGRIVAVGGEEPTQVLATARRCTTSPRGNGSHCHRCPLRATAK